MLKYAFCSFFKKEKKRKKEFEFEMINGNIFYSLFLNGY